MTRTGKIPRLPLSIRNTLGERLRDGEPNKSLVDWLNTLPEVQTIMAADFEGRPITEQNLSEWKNGGYLDWLRHQESLEWAAQMQEQVTELTQAASGVPLTDGVSSLLTVALGRLLQNAMAQPVETPGQRKELLGLAHELTRLRREELRAATLKLRQDNRADALRREAEKRALGEAFARDCRARQEQERLAAEPTLDQRLQRAIANVQFLTALSASQSPPSPASRPSQVPGSTSSSSEHPPSSVKYKYPATGIQTAQSDQIQPNPTTNSPDSVKTLSQQPTPATFTT